MVTAQVRARRNYDIDYINNKTGASSAVNAVVDALARNYSLSIDYRLSLLNTSELLACATMVPTAGRCPYGDGARELVAAAQARLIDQYQVASTQYEATVETFQDYAESAPPRPPNLKRRRPRSRGGASGWWEAGGDKLETNWKGAVGSFALLTYSCPYGQPIHAPAPSGWQRPPQR